MAHGIARTSSSRLMNRVPTRLLSMVVSSGFTYALSLVLKDEGERLVDQFGAQKGRRVLAFNVGVFSQVHADDSPLLRQCADQAQHVIPSQPARLRRPGGRNE